MFEITGHKSEMVGEQNLISLLLFLTGPPPSSLVNPGAPSPSPPASPLTPAPVLLFTGTQRLSPEQKGTVLWPCLCGLPGPWPFARMGGPCSALSLPHSSLRVSLLSFVSFFLCPFP